MSTVATELCDGVHQVRWDSTDKLEFTVFRSHEDSALNNFTSWCNTGPVSFVAVDISVSDQLESIVTFVLYSADLSWPVTLVVEPVVSSVFDFRNVAAVIISIWW